MTYDFLVGIGGSSMSGLAEVLRAEGHKVGGSDLKITGHRKEHITPDIDRLIISSAVQASSPGWVEVKAAEALGIPVVRRSAAIGQIMATHEGIAIAGTHGKTSTSTILGMLLDRLGADPLVMVGADVPGWQHGARLGKGRFMVAEACEYERQLVDFPAKHAIITSLEPDHFDTFRSEAELIDLFRDWVSHLPADGHLVLCHDALRLVKISQNYVGNLHWYGQGEYKNDYWYTDVDISANAMRFTLHTKTEHWPIVTSLIGEHQAANITAALLLLSQLGFPPVDVIPYLEHLTIAHRRLEHLGQVNGIQLFDDYGHHPTEIAATLKTLHQRYPGQRLVVVFQSHQISRTKALLADFVTALQATDQLILLPVFKVPGRDLDRPTGAALQTELADRLRAAGHLVITVDDYPEALSALKVAEAPDIVLTLGATNVDQVGQQFLAQPDKEKS